MSEAPRPATAVPTAFDATTLAAAVAGRLLVQSSRPIHGAAVDSRRVVAGNCFYALPGERTDGHLFVADAAERGAAAVVVSRDPEPETLDRLTAGRVAVIRVADGLAALHAAARAWRSLFTPLVVGITGSLAKTSTKEQVAEVLAERWNVLRNEANENNEIGLPLTLLRLRPEHEVAVLEMGMYVPGDIALLAALARPRIGVVTAVRGTHLARAGSIEAIQRGKRELVEALPAGGTAVLNGDDRLVVDMADRLPAGVLALTYGFAADAEVTAEDVESLGERGMALVLRRGGERAAVRIRSLGRHSVHNALAAAAVGLAAGLDLATIVRGLARPFSLPHRSRLIHAGAWRLLDDTYNAAPDSMVAALDTLADLPGRHVAVLGEMLELGDASTDAHRAVGRHAATRADLLVAVGPTSGDYAAGAREGGLPAASIVEAVDRDAALDALLRLLRPTDVVLLKGSRGAALDVLVDRLREAAAEGARA